MSEEQEILKIINNIHRAPVGEFSLVKHTSHWSIAVYKFLDLVDPAVIKLTKQDFKFPFFDLYFLNSLSILSAYVFYIPACLVYVNPYYLRLLLPSAKDLTKFSEAKLIMQDNKINVFHSHDGACLISVNGLKRVITPLMVRRSEKNMFEDQERNSNDQDKDLNA